ncbi:hypothetical protein NT6N_00670 [Oceaniferula spumae]|uniref:DUF4239 domain-containing protein n=1 Tax=Oceaniferula spumae TaxID=2979115 RepID=A0AAT9FGJ2_9BACT
MKAKPTGTSLIPILLTGLVTAGLTWLARHYLQYEDMENDVGVWGGYFTVFGVIYAIVAGFLLVEVLGRYGSLSNTIEAELNAIESLRDYLVYLGDEGKSSHSCIREALIDYLKSVRDEEWAAMGSEEGMVDSDTSDELYAIMRSIKNSIEPSHTDGVVYAALIDQSSEIAVQRTLRISLANQKLPLRLRILLIFMGVVLSAGFLLMPVMNLYVHLLMTTTLAMAIHLLSQIIDDLDHPFHGVWNLDRTALEQLIARFESNQPN